MNILTDITKQNKVKVTHKEGLTQLSNMSCIENNPRTPRTDKENIQQASNRGQALIEIVKENNLFPSLFISIMQNLIVYVCIVVLIV